jgi:hypothetical protein
LKFSSFQSPPLQQVFLADSREYKHVPPEVNNRKAAKIALTGILPAWISSVHAYTVCRILKNMAAVTAIFMFQKNGMRAKSLTNMFRNGAWWRKSLFERNWRHTLRQNIIH